MAKFLASWEGLYLTQRMGFTLLGIDSLMVYKFLNTHSPISPNYNILIFNCTTAHVIWVGTSPSLKGLRGLWTQVWVAQGEEGWGYTVDCKKKKLQVLSH